MLSSRHRSSLLLPATIALLALVAFLAVGCDGSDGPAATSGNATPVASPTTATEATPTATPGPLPAPIRAIMDNVAQLRGLPEPANLDAELVARSQLPALLDKLTTDKDRHWFATTTTLYRLLGHFRQDQDYLSIYLGFGSNDVLGLYSPADQKLWVVYDDSATPTFDNMSRQETLTLAHELTHALQDYSFHLQDVTNSVTDDLDRSLAYTAVVEGDAVTNENAYSAKYLSLLPTVGSGRLYLLGGASTFADTPPSITRELYFPYTTGADWIKSLRATSGTAAIDTLLAHPPAATSVILHPELLTSGWKPAQITLPDLSSKLGSGWSHESGGTFGEFQIRNYLQLRIRAGDAAAAAAGWAGDHYDVYVNGSQSVAAFRFRFSDPTEAAQFVTAQDTLLKTISINTTTQKGLTVVETTTGPTTARAATAGSDVIFAIGSTTDIAIKAAQALATN